MNPPTRQHRPSDAARGRSRAPVATAVAAAWAALHLALADSSPVVALAAVSLVALALAHRGGRRSARLAGVLLLASGVVVALVLADQRSLTLLGYLPMVLLHLAGLGPFASQDITIPVSVLLSLSHSIGGVGLLLSGLATLVRSGGRAVSHPGEDGERADHLERRRGAAMRVGRWSVAVAVVAPLVYASTRLAWALGIPLGVTDEFLVLLGDAKFAGLGLGLFAIVGALLTLGLVQRWGETFWSWLPIVGGRPVPVSLAVVPGLFIAMAVVSAGIGFARLILGGEVESLPGEPVDWAAWAPELLWVPWGVALGVAALAYRVRREST